MRHDAVPARWRAGVIIPIRSFVGAKERLAEVIEPDVRAEIAQRFADRVLDATAEMATFVVSDAPEVRAWASERDVEVLDDPGGLDAAAAAGVAHLAAIGFGRAVIAHADLPHARSLAPLARDAGQPVVALVPCHRDDGTNVLSIPVDAEFRFSYGPGSFRRHAAETTRLGLGLRVVRAPDLTVDVDVPEDLVHVDLSMVLR
jgi:2-phospho-L-lactate guanylyltransferase